MERWINIVEVNCVDASREKEFNDWYDNNHLPDVLETPGFLTARRYVQKEFRDGRGKYLTIYEIESDDIDKTMAVRREKRKIEAQQGRYGDILTAVITVVWNDVLWKLIAERTAAKEESHRMQKWINIVEVNCVDASREKEFNDWYDNIHLPDVLGSPGFLAARRYVQKEFRDGRGKYLTIYETESDDIDKTMALRREKRVRETQEGRGSDLWAPVWSDVLYRLVFELSRP